MKVIPIVWMPRFHMKVAIGSLHKHRVVVG